jgi:hypothetical protein
MNQGFESYRIGVWSVWAACGLAVFGGLAAIVAPAGGENRVVRAAVPLAVAALVLAASALTAFRKRWLGVVLSAAAALAILYGMLIALSLPLRLAVEGPCSPAPSPCPLGFDRPETSGESFAVLAIVICGSLALVFIFVAVEVRYVRRQRPTPPPSISPRSS